MLDVKLTAKQEAAIEAVKAAIKALPRGIHMSVDEFEGVVEFWKADRRWPGRSYGVSTPLRRKQAFNYTTSY